MTTTVKYISCISSQDRQRSVFRSLLTIIGQGIDSRLGAQWVYREDGPCDVAVVDFDDESASGRLDELGDAIVVALGRSRDALSGHTHALGKPLRWQDLLETLHSLEKRLRAPLTPSPSPVVAPVQPAPPSAPAPAPVEAPPAARPAAAAPAAVQETAAAGLLTLEDWPDRPRVDSVLQQDAARICALLSRRAADRAGVASFLGLTEERVQHVLDALAAVAHTGRPCLSATGAAAPADAPALATDIATGKPSSFLSKFWNRLRGG